MFRFFRRKSHTASDIAKLLGIKLRDFNVTVDGHSVVIRQQGYILAVVEILNTGMHAEIVFSTDIVPNFAAEIALLVNDILPAFVDTQFMYDATQVVPITASTTIN